MAGKDKPTGATAADKAFIANPDVSEVDAGTAATIAEAMELVDSIGKPEAIAAAGEEQVEELEPAEVVETAEEESAAVQEKKKIVIPEAIDLKEIQSLDKVLSTWLNVASEEEVRDVLQKFVAFHQDRYPAFNVVAIADAVIANQGDFAGPMNFRNLNRGNNEIRIGDKTPNVLAKFIKKMVKEDVIVTHYDATETESAEDAGEEQVEELEPAEVVETAEEESAAVQEKKKIVIPEAIDLKEMSAAESFIAWLNVASEEEIKDTLKAFKAQGYGKYKNFDVDAIATAVIANQGNFDGKDSFRNLRDDNPEIEMGFKVSTALTIFVRSKIIKNEIRTHYDATVEESESVEAVEDAVEEQVEESESVEAVEDAVEEQVEESEPAEAVEDAVEEQVEEPEPAEAVEDASEEQVEEPEPASLPIPIPGVLQNLFAKDGTLRSLMSKKEKDGADQFNWMAFTVLATSEEYKNLFNSRKLERKLKKVKKEISAILDADELPTVDQFVRKLIGINLLTNKKFLESVSPDRGVMRAFVTELYSNLDELRNADEMSESEEPAKEAVEAKKPYAVTKLLVAEMRQLKEEEDFPALKELFYDQMTQAAADNNKQAYDILSKLMLKAMSEINQSTKK